MVEVTAFGMPNAQRTLSGSIDRTRNAYVITNGCPGYRDNTNTAILLFRSIRNPFYTITTGSIEIKISDSGQRLVCETAGQGPKATTTPGDITVKKLASEITTEINQPATLIFNLSPLHSLSQNS